MSHFKPGDRVYVARRRDYPTARHRRLWVMIGEVSTDDR